MTLTSKTIKIDIKHEKWLESHPEINFSEWIREKIDESIEKERISKYKRKIKAIIVAAGHDKRLDPLNEDIPKCMLDVKGKTILERQIENIRSCNINNISIIKGYKQELINIPDVKYYINPDFEKNGIVSSLFFAEEEMDSDFIFLYSDIIFDRNLLEKLLKNYSDISLVSDLDWKERYKERIKLPTGEVELIEIEDDRVLKIGKSISPKKAHGEFIGLAMFSKKGAEILKKCYKNSVKKYKEKSFHESSSVNKAYFTDIIQEVIDNGYQVNYLDVYGDWIEIDTFEDYKKAWIKTIP
ncbi:MAG: phosphocholine cytidylyltransferase family protein [Thermoplasmatales archaeon]|nr:MAG: phosphocholine cytidylyltransferase family protein [Thermoplasmatales archaeon]